MRTLIARFRKYHRQIAVIFALPILLLVLTGISMPIAAKLSHWLPVLEGFHDTLYKLHTGNFFKGGDLYAVIIGSSLLGLLITGITLTPFFRPKRSVDS
jgi:cytochrome b subunit of formate dehydrogenase